MTVYYCAYYILLSCVWYARLSVWFGTPVELAFLLFNKKKYLYIKTASLFSYRDDLFNKKTDLEKYVHVHV